MPLSRRALLAASASLPLVATAATAKPDTWPTRPVRIVLPFPAGGTTDVVARFYAREAEAALGQPFLVDNKPGASTIIGTQEVARAAPDGNTLLFTQTSIVSNMALLSDTIQYDAFRDFVAVHKTFENYAILAVPAASPARTLADFIALARDAKQPMTYGTAGHGTTSHFFVELLAKQARLRMTHVPYKGDAPIVLDLLANRIEAGIVSGAAVKQYGDGLRPLAVSGRVRQRLLPDIPTFLEQGYTGIGNESFCGFFAPARTPPAVVQALNREFNRIGTLPQTRERLASAVLEPYAANSPEQFSAALKAAYAEWVANSKAVDIKTQ